ncbi:MAG TPA: preprotein translocase subunit SecE [Caulobacteraceae bacterium]|nr:preprotein translocase subunit SecE [Caulobacteraceae bacterium]
MAKDQGAIPTTIRPRGQGRSAPAAPPPAKRFNPADWITAAPKFFREVRAEARKVTWTSWKETWITSVMVGIMVVTASLFFFAIDSLFGVIMDWVLKFFGGTGS